MTSATDHLALGRIARRTGGVYVACLVVSFVAELGPGLWLLLTGVNVGDAEAGRPSGQQLAYPQAEARA